MGVDVGGHKYDISIQKGIAYETATISFVQADPVFSKIKDSLNGLDMFETGDTIVVSGSTDNDGTYVILIGNTPGEMTIEETLTDEAAGDLVTLTPPIYGFMTVPTDVEFRRRANDFAPVIGVPGAQLEYAEDIWRPWTMGDFRGGMGQEEWDDPTRFDIMTAGLRIYKNRITLDTRFFDDDVGVSAIKGVDFKGNHYDISNLTVRKRTTATGLWAVVHTAGHTITDICVFGDYLWISTWGSHLYHSQDGAAWTQRTCPYAYIQRLLPFREFLWAATHWKMWFSDAPRDTWDGEKYIVIGDGEQDAASVYDINGLAIIGGVIAIGRTNGIYEYQGSGKRAEGPIIAFENMAWEGNCKLFTVVDGFLYYNVGNRIKKTDLRGAEFDITPQMVGSTAKERYGFGIPVGGQGYQGHIYVAFDDMEGLYPALLEMPTIDIGGWRLVFKGANGTVVWGRGVWFSDIIDCLLFNDADGTKIQRFQSHSDAPYPTYVATASLTTSRFDAGDVWSKKIYNKLLAYARDLSTTETIKVEYEKDYSGIWMEIATFIGGRENSTPFCPLSHIALSATKIRLRITLSGGPTYTASTIAFVQATKKITDSASGLAGFETGDIIVVSGSASNNGVFNVATGGVGAEIVVTEALANEGVGASVTIKTVSKTPILILPLVASYIVRPDPTHAQQVAVRLEDNIMTHDNYKIPAGTAVTLKAFLRECEAFEFPIEYTDNDKEAWEVIISNTNELRSHAFTDQSGDRKQEDVMILSMREVQS